MDDLPDERDIIEKFIIKNNGIPIRAERFYDSHNSAEKVIENKIRECNGYIGLFDKKYGFVPPNNNPQKFSVTRIEFEAAKKLDLAISIIVARRTNRERKLKLRQFLKTISDYHDGRLVKKYDNIEDLENKLEELLPSFFNDMTTLGFPPEIAEGIILNSMNLSITHKHSQWYIKEKEKEYEIITTNEFESISKKILTNIKKNKSIIITGKHGIGKSTFTHLLISKNLDNLPTIINYSKIRKRIDNNILSQFSKKNLYILYDPFEPLSYASRTEISGNIFVQMTDDITSTVKDFINYNIKFILVLSEEAWNKTENGIITKKYKVENLNGVFKTSYAIEEIIRSYALRKNIANIGVLSSKIANSNDGYLLLAAYTGRMLQNKIKRKNIDELFRDSTIPVKKFFINYVWKVIMKEEEYSMAEKIITILFRLAHGKPTVRLARDLPLAFEYSSLRSNNLDFAEWISNLDDHLILESLSDSFLHIADIEYREQNPEIRSLLTGIETTMDIVESSKYFSLTRLIDITLLITVQNWVRQMIPTLNKDNLEHFISFFGNCLTGKKLENLDNINLYNYLIDNNNLSESGYYILFGKPPLIKDLLDFPAPLEIDMNINKEEMESQPEVDAEIYMSKLAYNAILYSITNKRENVSSILAIYALRKLNRTYEFLSPLYWNIGQRLITKISIENPEELLSLLLYINDLTSFGSVPSHAINQVINFKEIRDNLNLDVNQIGIIVYCRILLTQYFVGNDYERYDQMCRYIYYHKERYPQSGNLLFLFVSDILIRYEINSGRNIDNYIELINRALTFLEDSNNDIFMSEFLGKVNLFEDPKTFKSKWFDSIRNNVLYYRYLAFLYDDKVDRALQANNDFKIASVSTYNLNIDFRSMCLRMLQKGVNKRELYKMIERVEGSLYQISRAGLKNIISIAIICGDMKNTTIFKKYISLFGETDFLKTLIYGFFAISRTNVGQINSESKFDELISIFGTLWNIPNMSIIQFDEIFLKYNNISKNLLFKLSGFILLLLFLYIKKENPLLIKLIKYGSIQFPQLIIKNILESMLKCNINNRSTFLNKIRKLCIISSLNSI